MKLACLTDLHGSHEALQRILTDAGPVDTVLLGGDVTNFGSPDEAEALVRTAQQIGVPVWGVAGNCDSPQIERRLEELGVSLRGRGVVQEDVGLHGLPAMPPWRTGMYQFTEEELAAMLQAGYAQVADVKYHVVLSHAPPHRTQLDRTRLFQHVGSKALRQFIDQTQPALVLCGHIHEARGVDRLGATVAVNCGAAVAGFYALADLGPEVNVELRRA